MLPKRYHALAFLSILVMLLLLGLHLLGFSFLGSGGQTGAASQRSAAALARNSSGSASSLLSPTGASSNAVYRHPIVYDKLTGATNNQISDVLGATKQDQYPLDHYQQQQQNARGQSNPFGDQFGQAQDPLQDPFGSRPFGGPPPPPPHPHHLAHHPHALRPLSMGPPPPHPHQLPPPLPPPPPPPMSHQQHMMTTQPPSRQQAGSSAGAEQRQSQQDSIPSASSVNNNGAARPLNASQPGQFVQPQQQPIYYTPPIFTYGGSADQQPASAYQPQVPPLGVPEVPLSVEEYNARQNRLRQATNNPQQQAQLGDEQANSKQVNLLADPQAQQRHKAQMLDRQLLFGAPQSHNHNNNNLNFMQPPPPPLDNYTAAAYYPDPALYARLQPSHNQNTIRPPYAHQMQAQNYPPPPQTQLEAPTQLMAPLKQQQGPAQNRIMTTSQRPPERLVSVVASPRLPPAQQPPVGGSLVRSGQQAPNGQPINALPSNRLALQELQAAPTCARQQSLATPSSLEAANTTSQLPVLFCNEDPDYPTTEIMRALEQFALERSIEQILPQQLVQMLTSRQVQGENGNKLADLQRQLSLDSLQANINAQQIGSSGNNHQLARTSGGGGGTDEDQQQVPGIFPTSNYDSLCRSVTWMAQPRRAKNLSGQWKVVVNLPGHKFRGIAISQMVRVDECSRPNGECAPSGASKQTQAMPARSRCLQHYDNQRLLAWSNQQGLHFDIFRIPIACSCHIRRF